MSAIGRVNVNSVGRVSKFIDLQQLILKLFRMSVREHFCHPDAGEIFD